SSTSASVTSFGCSDIGGNSVVLTVSDQSSNTDTCTATVTVSDTIAPTAVCQTVSVFLDASGNGSITSSDVDGGSNDNCSISSLTVSATTFGCSDLGNNTVTLTVTDSSSNVDSCTASVVVADTVAPTASCLNVTVQLDAMGSASITTTDIDGGSTDACGVDSLALSATTFGCAEVGSNAITLAVFDVNGNVGTCTATVTVEDTVAPTAVCTSTTIYLDANGNAVLDPAAVDGGSSDNCSIDSSSVDVALFTCVDTGANPVVLTVFDAGGNSDACTTTIFVEDTLAPNAVCQNITVFLNPMGMGGAPPAALDGGSTDNCGVTGFNSQPMMFGCADVGMPIDRTLLVFDAAGNLDSCLAMVMVLDTVPPLMLCVPDTIYLDQTGTATLQPSDIDGGSQDACGPVALSLSQTSFNGQFVGLNQVTLFGTDPNGNVDSCTAEVTVADTLGTGVEEGLLGANFELELWPNPTFDDVNVKIVCEACWNVDGMVLRLVSVAGQVVLQREISMEAGEHRTRIDLRGLSAGPYMLMLERDGERISRRVVKF
ncbi:MAG: HYR domain-containing protein, partial [Bacteroidota bacterium]